MRILLTNDDGIRAPGILALHQALTLGTATHPGPLRSRHHTSAPALLTVAPLTVQSATGHGITFHAPLMTRDEVLPFAMDLPGQRDPVVGVAVDGRPADCVKVAISNIWPQRMGGSDSGGANAGGGKPDLLISGMNAGANCGLNVIYSGTVAAAIEGAFLGIPSIAVSLRLGRGRTRYDLAAARARYVLEKIMANGGPAPGEVLSINIPTTEDSHPPLPPPSKSPSPPELAGTARHDPRAGDPHAMPAIVVCPMNVHGLVDKYEPRTAPSGETYYWAAGHGLDFHATEPLSDVDQLMQGRITVTPLTFDLTRHAALARWTQALA
jgi:5'-nucleotidase